MDEELYCLNLDDYSAASFTSFGKAYYGTMPQISAFIKALAEDERSRKNHEELITAFQEYQRGNLDVCHTVAYQKIPLLEPVIVIGTATQRLNHYRWEHLNTWRWPYHMRCDCVEARHYWIKADGYYTRCITARFENLAYEGIGDSWVSVGDMIWGFPHIIEVNGRYSFNRLAVEEKRFTRHKDLIADKEAFQMAHDVNFTEFCNDIFGDG